MSVAHGAGPAKSALAAHADRERGHAHEQALHARAVDALASLA